MTGSPVPSIIELLKARASRGTRAPHGDGARIALAVEGGAMRGVVSAGMVSALEALGLVNGFDAVYGSSAGAINAAYFLAGQAAYGTAIYAEDINNRHFIDIRRILTSRPVVSLDFLLDEVAIKRKTLLTGRVLGSPSPLTVMATDVAGASRAPLRDFQSGASLLTALKAGATMPALAGPPVSFGNRMYLDASLTEPIPVSMAEDDGHTHVLVLLTRPGGSPRATSAFDRWYVLPKLRRISPALAQLYVDRAEPYARVLQAVATGKGPAGRASVLAIQPPPPVISKLERSAERLKAAAKAGFESVMRTFGQ